MITVTNNMKEFMEKNTGMIILYGAGNSGYWTGYYMNKCNIDFCCYFDKGHQRDKMFMNGKPIFHPSKFVDFQGKPLRIIVTANCYEAILADLLEYDRQYNLSILCLVPKYKSTRTYKAGEVYNINKMLGYFRRKLFIGDYPTIVCSDCTGGRIYEMMDMIPNSPTVNTGIYPDDFIKICRDPQHYLTQSVKDFFWTVSYFDKEEYPVGKLDDIFIHFHHFESEEMAIKTWESLKEHINWNRLIFVLSDAGTIPMSVQKEFDALEAEHLTIIREHRSVFINVSASKYLYMHDWYFRDEKTVIENHFDLLGWLNKEYE